MHNLGLTRSSRKHDHLLQTPDAFVRAPLPGMRNATAVVHVHPAIGAAFTQYTVEFQADGNLRISDDQMFLFVHEGTLNIPGETLSPGGYAYLPPGSTGQVHTREAARVTVIEKPYASLPGVPVPAAFHNREHECPPKPLMGDAALEVRQLIPESPAFDFAVNTMTFQPGASLPMTEIHVMEHGLLMLEGGGIYKLNDHWYPVTAGDFIWMAPYCPQWFAALGKVPAKYLIYKDWNR